MTIRGRLTLWYAGVLGVSLALICVVSYSEFTEQFKAHHEKGEDPPLEETGEILFKVGLPSVILGVIGGWLIARRALKPLAELTHAAQGIDERTLGTPLPRSHNGDELDELARVLNAMQERLNQAFAQVREFTLHASHELKTPLTVMHGELETAMNEKDLSPAERERHLSQLDELLRLSKIVDGLTLLTRADSGQLHLPTEPLALEELVRDIHADAIILAEPSGVRVELARCEPSIIRGNRDRLRQLFLNLADNSVKYNISGGKIVMALARAGEWVEFTIGNTGPGILPEHLPKVFERFFRGELACASGLDGCGLGLSIVRWITLAHGGTIQVDSKPSEWTTFTVRLPLASSGAS